MAEKTKVKIIVTALNNAPIVGVTSDSVVAAMNAFKDADGKISDFDITQYAVASATEGESFLRGLHTLSDGNMPIVVPEWNASNLKAVSDIVVVVRNGVEFGVDAFTAVLKAAVESESDKFCCAAAKTGQLWMHGSIDFEAVIPDGDINGVDNAVFVPAIAKLGVKPGLKGFAAFCLAAFRPTALIGVAPGACFDTYVSDGKEFRHIDFDQNICFAMRDKSVFEVIDAAVEWHGAVDVHKAFHAMLGDIQSRANLQNPLATTVNANLLMRGYLDANKVGDIKAMHTAVSEIAITILNTLQGFGCKIATEGLGLDDLMALGLSGAPAASAENIAVPEVATAGESDDKVTPFKK